MADPLVASPATPSSLASTIPRRAIDLVVKRATDGFDPPLVVDAVDRDD